MKHQILKFTAVLSFLVLGVGCQNPNLSELEQSSYQPSWQDGYSNSGQPYIDPAGQSEPLYVTAQQLGYRPYPSTFCTYEISTLYSPAEHACLIARDGCQSAYARKMGFQYDSEKACEL